MNTDELRSLLLTAADSIERSRDRLNALDRVAGDGDHGLTMSLAARALKSRLDDSPNLDLAGLVDAATASFREVGGATGPLFSGGIAAANSQATLLPQEIGLVDGLAIVVAAAQRAVVTIGEVHPGDKSVVDAMDALRSSLEESRRIGRDACSALRAAADATETAAAGTAGMAARVGRASRLGERSRGAPDAGATSLAVIVSSMVLAYTRARCSGGSTERARRPLIGASFKMHLTSSETEAYLRALLPRVADLTDRDLFVLPAFTSIWVARSLLERSNISWGGQALHAADSGPFTGEVSAPMLADLGCTYVEIAHAERRHAHGDTHASALPKVRATLAWGMTPILCVGEDERAGESMAGSIVCQQLGTALGGLPPSELAATVVAYEPTWAIGASGSPAPSGHVSSVVEAIRAWLAERGDEATRCRVIYGGGVDRQSASQLAATGVDGLFIGDGALDPVAFSEIAHVIVQLTDSALAASA